MFVGFDYDGREKYAFKRSSNTNIPYRGEATGSNKSVGFSMGLVDRTPRRLFVTEAAIDALSLKSLMLIHGIDDSDCAYLACGGTASNALLYHILHHPQIQKIYLCMDNDEARHTARKNFRSELKTVGFSGKVIDKIPIGKDFNEDLKTLRETAPAMKQNQNTKERGLSYEHSYTR